MATAACHGPADGARNVPATGAWRPERRAGLRISKDQRSRPDEHRTQTRNGLRAHW